MDAATLWETFAEHAAIVMSGGRAPARGSGRGWFAVVTGEGHVELNQCALTSRATAADGRALVAFLTEHDVPALVSVASTAGAEVTAPLAAAGFERAPVAEPLMWCPQRPPRVTGGLRVAEVRSAAERERALAIIADAHVMETEMAGRALATLPAPDGRIAAWLAYAGDEAISVAWVTPGPRIGVWEMMTPARHRRRGAARAVLTSALHAAWDPATEGAFLLSTPAGRPFYEAVGFTAADDAVSWTIGADEALLAAIGQPSG
jgi:GNAT superfamily N-acetyltransferase